MSRVSGKGSLFDRLEPDLLQRRSVQSNELPARIHSIKRNIELLLNTRQGFSQSSPDVGLPEFTDATSGSSELLIRTSAGIRDAIQSYEPRVIVRDVHFIPNPHAPLELNFRLACVLAVDSKDAVLEVDLVMNGHNRHYRVL
ncbi:type VI secretion system baseplate subunit TssE [Stenotrophomonas nematodicola]|uniref:Type VI secretion system baseplate subunit TssE n=1 Tax=Stenotrophomonas nematodicola TaxID=2656746 RepID=A0ABW7D340_9GAMM